MSLSTHSPFRANGQSNHQHRPYSRRPLAVEFTFPLESLAPRELAAVLHNSPASWQNGDFPGTGFCRLEQLDIQVRSTSRRTKLLFRDTAHFRDYWHIWRAQSTCYLCEEQSL
jgi:hypothetical protein